MWPHFRSSLDLGQGADAVQPTGGRVVTSKPVDEGCVAGVSLLAQQLREGDPRPKAGADMQEKYGMVLILIPCGDLDRAVSGDDDAVAAMNILLTGGQLRHNAFV
jgi:hypothetical protein